jgi:hypothetical protein
MFNNIVVRCLFLTCFLTQDAEAYPGVVYFFKKHANKTVINTIEKQSIMHKSMTVKQKKRVVSSPFFSRMQSKPVWFIQTKNIHTKFNITIK